MMTTLTFFATIGCMSMLATDNVPWPEHPRPDFARTPWVNLNGPWPFAFDPQDAGEKDQWFTPGRHAFDRRIVVPFPWESRLSGIGDTEYKGAAWYSRDITLPSGSQWDGRDVWLVVGACDFEAKVWVNGQPAAEHVGGYTPFDVNLAPFAKPGEKVTVTIRAMDTTNDQQPTGKQVHWYTRTSGIWQTVYLEPRGKSFIQALRGRPDIRAGKMAYEVTTSHRPPGRLILRSPSKQFDTVEVVIPQGETPIVGEVTVKEPKLWSPDSPSLYDIHIELADDQGNITDRVESYFGLREVSVGKAPGRDYQYIFLNGRYIRDRFVSHAVREAYRGLMEPSRYPVFFVRMEVDPAGVDVNVHPTKSEVRWRDSNVVYSQVLSSLRDRFLSADLTPAYRPGPAAFASGSGGGGTTDGEPDTEAEALRRQRIRESMADFFKRQSPGSPATSPEARPPWPTSGPRPDRPPGAGQFTMPADPGLWPPPGGYTQPASPPLSHEWADVHGVEGTLPAYRNTIQVHDAFLVAETDDGLTIIDQHALHERVLYEQFSRQIARGPLESQRLLLSETVDVTPDEVALLDTHGELFGQLGFELSAYGPSTIAVHATPSLLKPDRVSEFLRDAFGRLADRDAPASAELLLDALISMMACKAAVKAGDPLSSQEIEALMAKRDLVERSSNCPHGRPTSLNLSLADLEKQFKRT